MGSGIINLVSQAGQGQYKTISQVATEVGRSMSAIKNAIRSGKVSGPTHRMTLGDGTTGQFVWLYTEADIRRLQKYFSELQPGPKKKRTTVRVRKSAA
ncbi:hypothetical protein [Streptomyces sp. NPDC006477]|uniref:hypothetical protein n=1 Tax=Streptomyces sp. NPDC006477 TaxID=3364747 RepID=UPI003689E4A3